MNRNTDGLPNVLEYLTIWLLNRVGPWWTEKFYNAINRITALTAVYPVILRQNHNGHLEVLLTPRKDRIYTGVHHPGSMVRFTDKPGSNPKYMGFDDAINRVFRGELPRLEYFQLSFVTTFFMQTPRGAEVAVVFVCEVDEDEEITVGTWYNVEHLPNNLLAHEFAVNHCATKHFMSR